MANDRRLGEAVLLRRQNHEKFRTESWQDLAMTRHGEGRGRSEGKERGHWLSESVMESCVTGGEGVRGWDVQI